MAAEKTPDSVWTTTLGGYKLIIADYSSTNIDDNDYWTSGITSKVAHFFGSTKDGSDFCIDGYTRSTGLLTFGSSTDNTGTLFILCRDN